MIKNEDNESLLFDCVGIGSKFRIVFWKNDNFQL